MGVFCYLHWTDQNIPPSFTKKLTKMDKVLGSSIHMECKVSGSLPISAQWFKDGKEISTSAKYRLMCHENTVALDVNNLELEDTANYTCKVSNVAGDDACSGILTVKGQSSLPLLDSFLRLPFKCYHSYLVSLRAKGLNDSVSLCTYLSSRNIQSLPLFNNVFLYIHKTIRSNSTTGI